MNHPSSKPGHRPAVAIESGALAFGHASQAFVGSDMATEIYW
jgi:hypothetical protein